MLREDKDVDGRDKPGHDGQLLRSERITLIEVPRSGRRSGCWRVFSLGSQREAKTRGNGPRYIPKCPWAGIVRRAVRPSTMRYHTPAEPSQVSIRKKMMAPRIGPSNRPMPPTSTLNIM